MLDVKFKGFVMEEEHVGVDLKTLDMFHAFGAMQGWSMFFSGSLPLGAYALTGMQRHSSLTRSHVSSSCQASETDF